MEAEVDEPVCVVFDCESDSGFGGATGNVERMEVITHSMQPTVVTAVVVPSSLVLSGADEQTVLQRCVRKSWWRDVAEEGSNPFVSLIALFDKAEVIVGYNSLGFDFPLIKRFYRKDAQRSAEERYFHHRSKSLDVMLRIRDATGRYFKLDRVLSDNGLPVKIGDGQKAIALWNDQKRDELEAYCAADVELTLRLSLKDSLRLEGVAGRFSGQVHGLRSAIAARRAALPQYDGFVII